ncbi:hypothetical protein L596_009485 [Steinernema carpocapsae]|uniref:G-protein coupled receptors family 1 profile domain-containing protein n=1 Tax=Steinernema carpocapsae TaxID=34508 RepID=A0A4U5PFZ8_STECR|nr:hypothetical protein L596_009485 [Steinernema carpocapsae]
MSFSVLYALTILRSRSILPSQNDVQKKIFYTSFYIIVVYILLWVAPKGTYFLAKVVFRNSLVSSIFLQINGIADNAMTLANFAIYGWRHREVRVAIVDMLCAKKPLMVQQVEPMTTEPTPVK